MVHHEIVLAGLGGHGIIFMGRVLGYAAILSGKDAVMTTSYSPAQRGGWSKAYLVIDDEPIEYPVVTRADALVATTLEMLYSELHLLRDNGILIIDSDIIREVPRDLSRYRVYRVPAHTMALKTSGNERTANMVLLGALIGLTRIIDPEYIIKSLKHNVRRKELLEPNINSFTNAYQKYMSI